MVQQARKSEAVVYPQHAELLAKLQASAGRFQAQQRWEVVSPSGRVLASFAFQSIAILLALKLEALYGGSHTARQAVP